MASTTASSSFPRAPSPASKSRCHHQSGGGGDASARSGAHSCDDADGDSIDDLYVSTGCYMDEQEKGICKEPLTYLYRAAKDGLHVDQPAIGVKLPEL